VDVQLFTDFCKKLLCEVVHPDIEKCVLESDFAAELLKAGTPHHCDVLPPPMPPPAPSVNQSLNNHHDGPNSRSSLPAVSNNGTRPEQGPAPRSSSADKMHRGMSKVGSTAGMRRTQRDRKDASSSERSLQLNGAARQPRANGVVTSAAAARLPSRSQSPRTAPTVRSANAGRSTTPGVVAPTRSGTGRVGVPTSRGRLLQAVTPATPRAESSEALPQSRPTPENEESRAESSERAQVPVALQSQQPQQAPTGTTPRVSPPWAWSRPQGGGENGASAVRRQPGGIGQASAPASTRDRISPIAPRISSSARLQVDDGTGTEPPAEKRQGNWRPGTASVPTPPVPGRPRSKSPTGPAPSNPRLGARALSPLGVGQPSHVAGQAYAAAEARRMASRTRTVPGQAAARGVGQSASPGPRSQDSQSMGNRTIPPRSGARSPMASQARTGSRTPQPDSRPVLAASQRQPRAGSRSRLGEGGRDGSLQSNRGASPLPGGYGTPGQPRVTSVTRAYRGFPASRR